MRLIGKSSESAVCLELSCASEQDSRDRLFYKNVATCRRCVLVGLDGCRDAVFDSSSVREHLELHARSGHLGLFKDKPEKLAELVEIVKKHVAQPRVYPRY